MVTASPHRHLPLPRFLPLHHLVLRLALLVLTLMALPAVAADLTASVDRDQISEGETFTLTLRYGGQALGEPDFSDLEAQFEILSSQRQSHLSIGRGADSSSTEWRLSLMPRDTGTLVIPSFRFRGQVSDALQVEVREPSASSGEQQPFFVETELDTLTPRVHEQVVLTFRVHSAEPLLSLSAAELEVPGARLIRIHEAQYQRTLDGNNYAVVEVRYALFAERAGPLEIPSLRFRGEVPDADSNIRSFGFSAFGQNRKPVMMTSPVQRLDVLPRPDSIPATEWLPSKGVSLAQRWSRELDQLVVGEPVTRTVIVSAQGLQGAQLPPLDNGPQDDFRFYPDQARVEDNVGANGIVGTRIESTAIIPTRAGELELPPIRVQWWDTVSGEARETVLEAVTVRVAPAPEAAVDAGDAPAVAAEDALPTSGVTASYWLWLSALANLLLALLVLIFALLWWRGRRSADPAIPTADVDDEQRAFRRIRQCSAGQPAELRSAILHWARLRWPQRLAITLDDIATISGDPQLESLFARLDATLYARQSGEAPVRDGELADLVAALDRLRDGAGREGGRPALPDLYPA